MTAAGRGDDRIGPPAVDRPAPFPPFVVVDASVFAALVFNEPRSREAADLLTGATLAAPGLVRYEMANIARTKALKDPPSTDLIVRALARWLDLPVHTVEPGFREVVAVSLAEGLSAYDAAYLVTASTLRAPLLTFDERLAETHRRFAG